MAHAVQMAHPGTAGIAPALPHPTSQLDWRAKIWLKTMDSIGWPKVSDSSVAEARRDLRLLLQTTSIWRPVKRVQEVTIPGPHGPIAMRIYTPLVPRAGALLVWFHGGGFVVGDLETADPTCRSLAERSGATVISVDYRLSPENHFSAGVDDAYAATLWAFAHARALGCDPARVAIGGDSAGGTLTALVAQRLKAASGPQVALQLLVYPCTDISQGLANRDPGVAHFLTWETVAWFESQSSGDLDRTDPAVSAYYSPDVSGLAPAVLITAECDLLCTDGEAYGERLKAAGVPVAQKRYDGQIHGFFMMDMVFPAAREAHRFAAEALRAMKPVAQPASLVQKPLPPTVRTLSPAQRLAKVTMDRSPAMIGIRLATTMFNHWRGGLATSFGLR